MSCSKLVLVLYLIASKAQAVFSHTLEWKAVTHECREADKILSYHALFNTVHIFLYNQGNMKKAG